MKKKNLIFKIFLLTVLIIIFMFRNLSYKGRINMVISDYVRGPGTNLSFYIPLFSYNFENINDSVTMKSLRNGAVLRREIKNTFEKYEKITCDGKEYYYNSDIGDSYTITEYDVKKHFIYSEIYYKYSLGNYCETKEVDKTLDFMSVYYYEFEKDNTIYSINLLVGTPNDTYSAQLNIYLKDSSDIIEKSKGKFEINNNKLIYKRSSSMDYTDIKIPSESIFIIEDRNTLVLEVNYLSDLIDKVILRVQ